MNRIDISRKVFVALAIAAMTSLAMPGDAAAQAGGGKGGGAGGGSAGEGGGAHGGGGRISSPQPLLRYSAGARDAHEEEQERPQRFHIRTGGDRKCGYQQVGRGHSAIYLRFCGETLVN